MLEKLKRIGVTDVSLRWFKSYLTDRKVGTFLYSSMSDFSDIYHGVPQGSILGPILFVIYINDIVQQVNNCSIQLYMRMTRYCTSHTKIRHTLNLC